MHYLFSKEAIWATRPLDLTPISPVAMVSGFHSITEADSVFQIRVIEANGKATVAFNPITLFVVVTNDSSAGDLQQHIWRLPFTVARVKSVAGIKSGVSIVAVVDTAPKINEKGKEFNLLVRYKLENGVLKDTIAVERVERQKESGRRGQR